MNQVGQGTEVGAAASIRWPNVPACYGWLSLDRRGGWRLKGDPIRHPGLIQFINRNYRPDGLGNWVFQNGPQVVFVELDYTPFVLRMETDGALLLHTGQPAGLPVAAFLDEEGNVLIQVQSGIGLLEDRDLAGFLAACRGLDGAGLADLPPDPTFGGEVPMQWLGLPLQPIRRRDVPAMFAFNPMPRPG